MDDDDGSDPVVIHADGEAFWVWGCGVYPAGSVLAGSPRAVRLERFDSLADAAAAYPQAELESSSPAAAAARPLPRLPPPWFDPDDAGESWDAPGDGST